MKRIVQCNNYCIIELAKAEEKTAGGIILTATTDEPRCEGTVISSPPESSILPGDYVLFPASLGYTFKADGKSLIMVKTEDIVARIEEVSNGQG